MYGVAIEMCLKISSQGISEFGVLIPQRACTGRGWPRGLEGALIFRNDLVRSQRKLTSVECKIEVPKNPYLH